MGFFIQPNALKRLNVRIFHPFSSPKTAVFPKQEFGFAPKIPKSIDNLFLRSGYLPKFIVIGTKFQDTPPILCISRRKSRLFSIFPSIFVDFRPGTDQYIVKLEHLLSKKDAIYFS
jgi:hypothetical protein